jgi:tRNA pseudouridine38-40 synthase
MYKYQILIEYVGTNYRGWQIQKKGQTIQGVLQDKISKLLKEKITVIGSGRTDAGVHAISQSAHFECKNLILDKDKFLKSINHFLKNKMISVLNLKKKNKEFHARYSAKERVYKYVIYNRISPPCFIMIEAGI